MRRMYSRYKWFAMLVAIVVQAVLTAAVAHGSDVRLLVGSQPDPVGSPGTKAQLTGLAYGNGRWVAVGGQDVLMQEGEADWSVALSQPVELNSVAFLHGYFIVSGHDVERGFFTATSVDGAHWNSVYPHTQKQIYPYLYPAEANGVQFAMSGTRQLMASKDGTAWTETGLWLPEFAYHVIFADGRYYLTIPGFGGAAYWTSADGLGWTRHQIPQFSQGLTDIAAGGGRLVLVGTGGAVFSSTDGSAWTPTLGGMSGQFSMASVSLTRVIYANGLFVAMGTESGSSTAVISSADGTHWDWRPVPGQLRDLAAANGEFKAVGDGGRIISLTVGSD